MVYGKKISILLIAAGLFLAFLSPELNAKPTIYVDQGDYSLRVVEDGKEVIEQRVIVGRPSRPTPMMTDKITHVVLNPTWTAPKKLARLDVVPKILKDMSAIERYGYQFFKDGIKVDPSTIDFAKKYTKEDDFPYTIVQKAGPVNALGKAKFILTNSLSIRMHGTPKKRLFEDDIREFSSGCIRIEYPIQLAKLLLTDKPIDAMIKSGKSEQWLKLPEPIDLVIEKKRKPVIQPVVVEIPVKVSNTAIYHSGVNQYRGM